MNQLAISLALIATLAACSGDSHERGAEKESASPGARSLAPEAGESQVDEYWSGLPDFENLAELLDADTFRMDEWEMQTAGDRDARLKALGIERIRVDRDDPLYSAEHAGQTAEAFRFVDFSGDGVADVIYGGAPWFRNEEGEVGTADGSQLILWQVMDGRAVQVLDAPTSLQRAWRGKPGEPLRLRTVQHGCCDERHILIEYHAPQLRGETVRYHVTRRIVGSTNNRAPRALFSRPRPFTVMQDRYRLRHEPDVRERMEDSESNVQAEYRQGARGLALAESRDSTGRVWWYVLMDGRTPPDTAAVSFAFDEERDVPEDRLGWMSSRFLTETPAAP